jgi:hypothetical protein
MPVLIPYRSTGSGFENGAVADAVLNSNLKWYQIELESILSR